jgi:hypothetical protein
LSWRASARIAFLDAGPIRARSKSNGLIVGTTASVCGNITVLEWAVRPITDPVLAVTSRWTVRPPTACPTSVRPRALSVTGTSPAL